MEKIPEIAVSSSEKHEKYGENVLISTKFIRHAEKGSFNGGLTPKGVGDAKAYGQAMEVHKDGIKGYFTPIERSQHTLDNIIGEVDAEKKFNSRLRYNLTYNLADKILFSDEAMKKYAKVTEENGGDETAALQWYLDFGDKRPDKGTISPKESAARFAKLVERYVKMSKKLKSGSAIDLIHVSHSGSIEPFLKELIGNAIDKEPINPEGNNFLEKLGGLINYLEGFGVDVKRSSKDSVELELEFRGRKYVITEKEIEDLAQQAPKDEDEI